jgi:hypothetical protein
MELHINICTDCVFADANGARTHADDGGPSSDWTGFLPGWDGWGFIAQTERFGDVHEIKEPHFSWWRCDGCGSGLGGDRWEYTAYEIRKDTA